MDAPAYHRALDRLLRLPDYERGSTPGAAASFNLERPRALLAALGEPQLARPCVLIAGSKGKGSTAALIDNLLRAHGFHTALYTQPHLQDYRERIRIDGRLIEPGAFASAATQVASAATAVARQQPTLGAPTTYEETTALFFVAAREAGVDWNVVEVGLGGRLDATNLSDPLVSVLTPIELEHREILGETIAAIATEKVAIVRPDRPAVVASQSDEALGVIHEACARRGARLQIAPAFGSPAIRAEPRVVRAGHFAPNPLHFWTVSLQARSHSYHALELPLPGEFQVSNLSTALHALEALPGASAWLDTRRVHEGVARVRLPGRIEVVSTTPLVILDGAHTPRSAEELARALRRTFAYQRLTLIFGCLRDKDAGALLRLLAPLASRVLVATARHPRARPAADLAALAGELGIRAVASESVSEALAAALRGAAPGDAVCVAGSLSAAGEARTALGLAPQ